MPNIVHRFLPVVALLSLVHMAPAVLAQPPNLNLKAVEVAQLPLFCWHDFGVPNTDGPQFHFPPYTECGWGMNHYCSGLLAIVRAKHASNRYLREGQLKLADNNVRYTERAIAAYPQCSLRPHVEGARTEVNSLASIYRIPLPKPQ